MTSSTGPETRPDGGRWVMPAEWEPHRATWIAWPHNRSDWPGRIEAVRWCYVEIVRRLAAAERVEIVFRDAGSERRALRRLARAGVDPERVGGHRFPTDRSWLRDSGGTFVRRAARSGPSAEVAAEAADGVGYTRRPGAPAEVAAEAADGVGYTRRPGAPAGVAAEAADGVGDTRQPGTPAGVAAEAADGVGDTRRPPARAEVALVDWRFNGWAKYDDWARDDRLPGRIAAARHVPRIVPRIGGRRRVVLEGGAIDVNGAGVALATEECLLDPAVQTRNPGLDREGVARVLGTHLGVDTVVWLGRGIAGDDTHGHVDDAARFVGPTTVVAADEPDPADENHAPLADNLRRLRAARVGGRALTVVPLPMPRPLRFDGQRLPASYLNFYVANGLVLVPTFNDPADRTALGRLAELFPGREVVGIHAVDLILGLGALHCLTLPEPAP